MARRASATDLQLLADHGLSVSRVDYGEGPSTDWGLSDKDGSCSIEGRGCAATLHEAVSEGLRRIAAGDYGAVA